MMLSIVIPAFNAAASIERALQSVVVERELELVCVVVDDGSTDGTAGLVAAIATTDPRVVLLRSGRNEGPSAARNRALEVVRGSWLTFLDADDRFVPGGIPALAGPTASGDVLAVIGQRVWADGERTWISSFYDIPDIRTPGRTSLADRPGLLYYASATGKLIHRSCFEGLRFHGRVLGDQPWTIRALLRAGDRIEVIGADVYEWSRPKRGTSGTSITAVTRSAARFGVEAVAVATDALADVAREAEARLGTGPAADHVIATYAERLLRSDLGVHLSRALARRDPGTGELETAIARFVDAAPAGAVARSDALAHDVLEPPLRAWRRLDGRGREGYFQLVDAALRADPDVGRRVRGVRSNSVFRPGTSPSGLALELLALELRVRHGLRRTGRRIGRIWRSLASR
jgi:hypothetical protein